MAYYYSHLMRSHNVDSKIYQPEYPSAQMAKTYYGYESGNPLNMDMQFYSRKDRLHLFREIGKDYDVVELHEGGGFYSTTLLFTPAKRIAHFHGSELRSKGLRKTLLRVGFRLSGFSHILLSTPDLKDHVWSKSAEVLLNPVDPSIKNTQDQSGGYLFLPTRIDDRIKGSNLVFEAWKTIREINHNATLMAINWGPDASRYVSSTKGDDRINWLPLLNRTEYVKALSRATLVLGQFNINILSLIELEAMQAGKPVISLNTSGIRTSSEIAKETIRLLSDDSYRRAVVSEQRRFLAPYDPELLARQLHNAYTRVLGT